jgi:23S rRNA (adenine2503-C2)-methyltransferase
VHSYTSGWWSPLGFANRSNDGRRTEFNHSSATGREITLEYLLLSGVNDRIAEAKELAELCHTLRCNVNLIRYNEVESIAFKRPQSAQVRRFQETLQNAGVNAHIRASRGRDIDAACGQLKRHYEVTTS